VLAVVGENIIDLVPVASGEDGTYRALAGGSPANIAVAAARLGTPTSLVARVSRDVLGRRVRARLAADGVDPRHLVPADEPSSLAVVHFDAERRASYDFWLTGTADWQWTDAELPHPLEDSVRALHVGSLAVHLEPGASAISRLVALERARGRVSITVDPNVRPAIVGDLDAARSRTEALVALADVVKVSDEDLEALHPGDDPELTARDWLDRGPALVVLTRGEHGAVALGRSGSAAARPPAIELTDTVGAGDSFMGTLLCRLAERDLLGGDRRAALEGLGDEELGEIVTVATTAAALACTREGADPPTAAELGGALQRPRAAAAPER